MQQIDLDRLSTFPPAPHFHWVSAVDISQGGVKVEGDRKLEEGAEVVVTFDRLRPLPGVVRWQNDGVAGISFNQIIPFTELAAWLKLPA
jgi:hypothetical protein